MSRAAVVENIRAIRHAERVKTPSQQPEHLRAASAQIKADVDAFIARGGQVQKLSHGAASRPLRTFKQLNEATWAARQEREGAKA